MDLQDLAQKMRNLDICHLVTITEDDDSGMNVMASRPMSNNKDVEFDGTSYFFTMDDTRMVDDIESYEDVMLNFNGENGLFISVQGKAEIIDDVDEFEAHWQDNLDQWFPDGPETDGLVMIKVEAVRVKYWQGEDNGEWLA